MSFITTILSFSCRPNMFLLWWKNSMLRDFIEKQFIFFLQSRLPNVRHLWAWLFCEDCAWLLRRYIERESSRGRECFPLGILHGRTWKTAGHLFYKDLEKGNVIVTRWSSKGHCLIFLLWLSKLWKRHYQLITMPKNS